ncbi:unnamed protein product [Paramecium primaurelia]|uniref:Uncharacterized protein n=1 Tax=Paramecium primaurelia TaxID=5886 RepID=A0A8S1PS34_PARPR|nr:unnamed protein product [Paramecium primaurelia]
MILKRDYYKRHIINHFYNFNQRKQYKKKLLLRIGQKLQNRDFILTLQQNLKLFIFQSKCIYGILYFNIIKIYIEWICILSFRHQNKKQQIAIVGDKGVGKHQLIEKMLDVESKVNDRDITSIDFFISYIWIGDCQYQTIHYWVISLDSNQQQFKSMPFIPQSDIYVIMFSLHQQQSMLNALHVWFQLSSQKQSAQYIFLGSDSGQLRQCGSYNEIIKIIKNKMIRSSPNLEQTQNESSLKEIRKTIAYVDDFIEESLPENFQYLEIKDNQYQAFKRVLINSVQNVISIDRQQLYSISAPISPNLMPQLQKSVSEFLQKTEYIDREDHLKSVKEKRQSEIIQTIKLDYSLHIQPIQTTMNPGFLTLEQSSCSQQVQKETGFCCQLI